MKKNVKTANEAQKKTVQKDFSKKTKVSSDSKKLKYESKYAKANDTHIKQVISEEENKIKITKKVLTMCNEYLGKKQIELIKNMRTGKNFS